MREILGGSANLEAGKTNTFKALMYAFGVDADNMPKGGVTGAGKDSSLCILNAPCTALRALPGVSIAAMSDLQHVVSSPRAQHVPNEQICVPQDQAVKRSRKKN